MNLTLVLDGQCGQLDVGGEVRRRAELPEEGERDFEVARARLQELDVRPLEPGLDILQYVGDADGWVEDSRVRGQARESEESRGGQGDQA